MKIDHIASAEGGNVATGYRWHGDPESVSGPTRAALERAAKAADGDEDPDALIDDLLAKLPRLVAHSRRLLSQNRKLKRENGQLKRENGQLKAQIVNLTGGG